MKESMFVSFLDTKVLIEKIILVQVEKNIFEDVVEKQVKMFVNFYSMIIGKIY